MAEMAGAGEWVGFSQSAPAGLGTMICKTWRPGEKTIGSLGDFYWRLTFTSLTG